MALLDTNVLVSLFNSGDVTHENTSQVIALGEYHWAVSQSVVIEAWNFLVGSLKNRTAAYNMMDCLLTPGNVDLIDDYSGCFGIVHAYSEKFRIDFVDSHLLDLASRISALFGYAPSIHIATYDTGDFLRLFGQPGLAFHVYDMRDMSSTNS